MCSTTSWSSGCMCWPRDARSRAATREAGRPSPRDSLLPCSTHPACYHGTNDLGCGRGCQRFDDRCALRVCPACCRAVLESCASANFGSAVSFRMASWLIALSYIVERMGRVGSAVAVALACGAFPACHDHVCVISCGTSYGGVPRVDSQELSSSPQIFRESENHIFEVREGPSNYLNASFYFFNVQSRDIHTV